MIVTIDGPAGAGKSSVAKRLADRLGFRFLDTGAMYRCVALAAVQRGIRWDEKDALAQLAGAITIDMHTNKVLLDGKDVTEAIRTSEITEATRHAADNEGVRRKMVQLQRRIVGGDDFVTEGRDQGTVAFPHADVKIYLTASPEERARRRMRELQRRGEQVTLDEVLARQIERDERDERRPYGGLTKSPDAVEVLTDGLSPDEVVENLVEIVRQAGSQSDSTPLN